VHTATLNKQDWRAVCRVEAPWCKPNLSLLDCVTLFLCLQSTASHSLRSAENAFQVQKNLVLQLSSNVSVRPHQVTVMLGPVMPCSEITCMASFTDVNLFFQFVFSDHFKDLKLLQIFIFTSLIKPLL